MIEAVKRRPWWVAALLGGGAAGATIVAGINGAAHGEQPKVAAAGIYAMHDEVTAEQLRGLTLTIGVLQTRLDQTISQVSELNGRLSRIEGRLEKR